MKKGLYLNTAQASARKLAQQNAILEVSDFPFIAESPTNASDKEDEIKSVRFNDETHNIQKMLVEDVDSEYTKGLRGEKSSAY